MKIELKVMVKRTLRNELMIAKNSVMANRNVGIKLLRMCDMRTEDAGLSVLNFNVLGQKWGANYHSFP